MKPPTYHGHVAAAELERIVQDRIWMTVDLGRKVRHIRVGERRIAMFRGPRAGFAVCTGCGTFAKISYVREANVGYDAFCSTPCLDAA